MMNIYVSRHGEEFGPYFIDDLRIDFASGCLLASDLVKYEGAAEWAPLGVFLSGHVPHFAVREPTFS